mgnify:CR=1 FL=1
MQSRYDFPEGDDLSALRTLAMRRAGDALGPESRAEADKLFGRVDWTAITDGVAGEHGGAERR